MTKHFALAIAAIAFIASGAYAQGRPNPNDPAAPVPPTAHESAFEGYRPFRDEEIVAWREVHETVHRAGGHVGILREEGRTAARDTEAVKPQATPGRAPGEGRTQKKQ